MAKIKLNQVFHAPAANTPKRDLREMEKAYRVEVWEEYVGQVYKYKFTYRITRPDGSTIGRYTSDVFADWHWYGFRLTKKRAAARIKQDVALRSAGNSRRVYEARV